MEKVENLHASYQQSEESQASVPHTCCRSQGCKEDALAQENEDQDKKQWAHTETQETFFYCEGD